MSDKEKEKEEVTDEDSLPTKVPPGTLVKPPSRFDRATIDYTINEKLKALIPVNANEAVVSIKLKAHGEERILTGVVATRIGEGFGFALSGALNLDNQKDYEVEFLGVISWK